MRQDGPTVPRITKPFKVYDYELVKDASGATVLKKSMIIIKQSEQLVGTLSDGTPTKRTVSIAQSYAKHCIKNLKLYYNPTRYPKSSAFGFRGWQARIVDWAIKSIAAISECAPVSHKKNSVFASSDRPRVQIDNIRVLLYTLGQFCNFLTDSTHLIELAFGLNGLDYIKAKKGSTILEPIESDYALLTIIKKFRDAKRSFTKILQAIIENKYYIVSFKPNFTSISAQKKHEAEGWDLRPEGLWLDQISDLTIIKYRGFLKTKSEAKPKETRARKKLRFAVAGSYTKTTSSIPKHLKSFGKSVPTSPKKITSEQLELLKEQNKQEAINQKRASLMVDLLNDSSP